MPHAGLDSSLTAFDHIFEQAFESVSGPRPREALRQQTASTPHLLRELRVCEQTSDPLSVNGRVPTINEVAADLVTHHRTQA